jgi:hypothetical protein
MYGLCVANILCCVMSLTVTLVGCTLGAQYSRYSQVKTLLTLFLNNLIIIVYKRIKSINYLVSTGQFYYQFLTALHKGTVSIACSQTQLV